MSYTDLQADTSSVFPFFKTEFEFSLPENILIF